MQLRDGRLTFSASDLTDFLECDHLTHLELRRVLAGIAREERHDEQAQLLRKKGLAHEQAYLDRLTAEGRDIARIEEPDAAAKTLASMRAGAEIIYQAAFESDGWRGYADFLIRVKKPSALGDYSYEPLDTKLALRAKPYFLLQLCFYAEQIATVQGVEPDHVHLVYGNNRCERFRHDDFCAYYRRVRTRFLEAVSSGGADTYPWPVAHCEICDWKEHCERRRDGDDHLSLVAGITRRQIMRLNDAAIATMADLGARPLPLDVARLTERTGERLRLQAQLQTHRRRTGSHRYELLPHEGPGRGFAALPVPDAGDVFFDMEGDPMFDMGAGGGGLEYLFGIYTADEGYRSWWAHTRADEKRALEEVIDYLIARLDAFPDMHVYHYASYEPSAIKRLMGVYGTREDQVDRLLTKKVFVDLYNVVRQSMRVSQPSYSIKKMEAFYMEARETDVKGGGESVVVYETWLETRDQRLLDDIEAYNKDDCISTMKLRDWLWKRREEAVATFGELPVEQPLEEKAQQVSDDEARRIAAAGALADGLPEDPEEFGRDERARWLLSHLLWYHRREDKPVYWAYYDRQRCSSDELLEDAECIAGLEHDGSAPGREKTSLLYRMTFPPQETKMRRDAQVVDAQTGEGAGVIDELDMARGCLVLRRGPKPQKLPLPKVIGPGKPLPTSAQRAALLRVAGDIVDRGVEAEGPYRAARDLLLAAPPRLRGRSSAAKSLLDGESIEKALPKVVADLDDSVLFIQGPPGTGKTYHAGGVICGLIDEGKKIAVAANSHHAINNVLTWVERRAKEMNVSFRGLKKGSGSGAFNGSFIESTDDNKEVEAALPDVQLVAGTAWLFSREAMDAQFDYLFIDEAGQIAIADAIAMATCAKNVVVIGDPVQLAQVSQGAHPPGAGVSVLEHLLGAHQTVPPDRGVFLDESWRMHEDVCSFISATMYEGRLHAHPNNQRQRVDEWGTGLRFVPVVHEGNRQTSEEEAEVIARLIDRMLGGQWTDRDGNRWPIGPADILVVAPYNAHVRCLRETLPDAIEVGTVDKFQGKEAPVTFFSMATSSGRELPRTLEFLFSRNRLNVAVSRARCLSYLVASPDLLRVVCKTLDQMRMVNALCRYVELADLVDVAAEPLR